MFCDMHPFPLQGSLCKTYFTKDDFYEFRNIIITCFLTKLGGGWVNSWFDVTHYTLYRHAYTDAMQRASICDVKSPTPLLTQSGKKWHSVTSIWHLWIANAILFKKRVQCTSNRCQDAFYKKYILWLGALEEEEEFFVYNFSLPQTSPGIPCFFPHQNQPMPVCVSVRY